MILHLADDEKFINHIIQVFEAVNSDQNLYLINSPTSFLNSIDLTLSKNIVVSDYKSREYLDIVKNNESFSAVIFHSLINPFKWLLIDLIDPKIPIHWMSWGADIYSAPKLKIHLYQPKTIKSVLSNQSYLTIFKNQLESINPIFYNLIYKVIKGKNTPFIDIKERMVRINSVSTVLPNEFKLIKRYFNSNTEYLPFKYASIEGLTKGLNSKICQSNNFLVGNSAYPTNNHLEAFNLISRINIEKIKIYTPLSYGNIEYRESITKKGFALLNDSFTPINDYLSIEDYNKILLNCGNCVMNSNRQQGMGNALISLWVGAKVYLNQKNLMYQYFNEIGIKFYSTQEIGSNYLRKNFNELMSTNRPIIEKLWGLENIHKEAEQIIKRLKS